MKRKNTFVTLLFCLLFVNGVNSFGTELTTVRPKERVTVLQGGAWFDTMTVLDAGETLVVIDTFASYKLAEKAAAYIEKTLKKPVSHVINTHHHWDHTFGNQVFKNAEIIGHRFCLEDMKSEYATPTDQLTAIKKTLDSMEKDHRGRPFLEKTHEELKSGFILTPPSLTVGDRYTLNVGDLTFKLYHVPGLHTRSNLTIYVPELGLVFTRRDFHQNHLPALEKGVDMDKLIHSLEDILSPKKPVEFIMVGHGNPLPDPDLSIALSYLKHLWKLVKEAKKQGKSMAEAETMFNKDTALAKRVENALSKHRSNLSILYSAPRL